MGNSERGSNDRSGLRSVTLISPFFFFSHPKVSMLRRRGVTYVTRDCSSWLRVKLFGYRYFGITVSIRCVYELFIPPPRIIISARKQRTAFLLAPLLRFCSTGEFADWGCRIYKRRPRWDRWIKPFCNEKLYNRSTRAKGVRKKKDGKKGKEEKVELLYLLASFFVRRRKTIDIRSHEETPSIVFDSSSRVRPSNLYRRRD